MDKKMELQEVIYQILVMQIDFGVYRYGDRLPTIEEAAKLLYVSIEPIRTAYMRLKQEGYITLSRKNGAIVKIQYGRQEIRQNVQNFFAPRREALLDLCRAMKPLFSQLLWTGLKSAAPESLDELEALTRREDLLGSHIMIRNMQLIYGSLENDLLTRLAWQVIMFLHAPFVSTEVEFFRHNRENNPLRSMVLLCRAKDWEALRTAAEDFYDQLADSLSAFFEAEITEPYDGPQVTFQWNSYKKSSQICYSLGMEILTGVCQGRYEAGTFLPSLQRMADERNVSIITVRRTLALLGSFGVTKSINGQGTRILNAREITENCDLTQPAVRRRLLDYTQSFKIIALSCKKVVELTLSVPDGSVPAQFRERLILLRSIGSSHLAAYGIVELITHLAPSSAVKTIYSELLQQLMWGYPLQSTYMEVDPLRGSHADILDYFLECLDQSNIKGLSTKLEEILLMEQDFTARHLASIGILPGASST